MSFGNTFCNVDPDLLIIILINALNQIYSGPTSTTLPLNQTSYTVSTIQKCYEQKKLVVMRIQREGRTLVAFLFDFPVCFQL